MGSLVADPDFYAERSGVTDQEHSSVGAQDPRENSTTLHRSGAAAGVRSFAVPTATTSVRVQQTAQTFDAVVVFRRL